MGYQNEQSVPKISSDIITLKNQIDRATEQISNSDFRSAEENGALIYLGNVHDSIPRTLIHDVALSSRDIHLWQLLKVTVKDPLKPEMLPDQELLGQYMKCSRPIVSQSLCVLRITRWVTLCSRVRDKKSGKYIGNVYAIHSEPLSFSETAFLDNEYMDLIYKCENGTNKRLRELAQATTDNLLGQIEAGINIGVPVSQLQQSIKTLNGYHYTNLVKEEVIKQKQIERNIHVKNLYMDNGSSNNHVKNFNTDENEKLYMDQGVTDSHVKNLDFEKKGESDAVFDHVKNFDMAEEKKLNMATLGLHIRSSSNIINNTTTYVGEPCQKNESADESNKTEPKRYKLRSDLVFPGQIKESEMAQARMIISCIDPENQQYMLNYLKDRLAAAKQGYDKPVYNPLGFLTKICKKFNAGTLEPSSYGLRDNNESRPTKPKETPEEARKAWEAGIRRMGIDPATNKKLGVKDGE